MKIQHRLGMSLFLAVIFCALTLGLATLHNVWTYAQNNLTQALNQTVNETDIQVDNQSLSPTIPGQQGGTPPKTDPS